MLFPVTNLYALPGSQGLTFIPVFENWDVNHQPRWCSPESCASCASCASTLPPPRLMDEPPGCCPALSDDRARGTQDLPPLSPVSCPSPGYSKQSNASISERGPNQGWASETRPAGKPPPSHWCLPRQQDRMRFCPVGMLGAPSRCPSKARQDPASLLQERRLLGSLRPPRRDHRGGVGGNACLPSSHVLLLEPEPRAVNAGSSQPPLLQKRQTPKHRCPSSLGTDLGQEAQAAPQRLTL